MSCYLSTVGHEDQLEGYAVKTPITKNDRYSRFVDAQTPSQLELQAASARTELRDLNILGIASNMDSLTWEPVQCLRVRSRECNLSNLQQHKARASRLVDVRNSFQTGCSLLRDDECWTWIYRLARFSVLVLHTSMHLAVDNYVHYADGLWFTYD
eukprot:5608184-Pleurochrysis_carterae.AAC.2